jgi:two-component system C4-dicarboxylate transport sensor histidine kinase DctB
VSPEPPPAPPVAASRGVDFAAAHARFGRTVTSLYLATAAVGVGLMLMTLAADQTHEIETARQTLALEAQVRAAFVARHLHLLTEELMRLAVRAEVDLADQNMEPERALLRLAHERSTLFNDGVALLGPDGAVLWSEPRPFLAEGAGAAELQAVDRVGRSRSPEIMAAPPPRDAPRLYIAAPIVRSGLFVGAVLGVVDLDRDAILERAGTQRAGTTVALVDEAGRVVHPATAASLVEALWAARGSAGLPSLAQATVGDHERVAAAAPVQGTSIALMSITDADILFGPARRRLKTRLALTLALAVVPLLGLVISLRRSLRAFRESEADAVRNERLRSLGQAVDLIAHEVKNALNGLRVGIDLILRRENALEARQRQAVAGLRTEIARLADFTADLLTFSKGVAPRPVALDLAEFVPKVVDLARVTAESRGVELRLLLPSQRVPVRIDPTLVHVAIANLVGNALDFATEGGRRPVAEVRVEVVEGRACITVSDNGPGVKPDVRTRLFEPFATGRPNGVGLGLHLARAVASAHGGDLRLEQSNEGARFRMSIPLEAS